VQDDEGVFRALADPSRRLLLDRLRGRDGQTLTELTSVLSMTRFGVRKHLQVLEDAGLVTARKVGRERRHYLNPVPIQRVADRWVGRFRHAAGLLADLTDALEATMPTDTTDAATEPGAPPAHVLRTYIRTTPEQIWRAITETEFTLQYFFHSTIESTWEPGTPYTMAIDGDVAIEGEVLEAEAPHRLVQSWRKHWDGEGDDVPTTRVTWEIEAQGSMCLLTVVHDGWSADDHSDTYQQVQGGWPLILSGLKTLLETGQPLAAS
jgi:uncharacterized protein YndB with AHSA1/START domain/DNA-binding transcriptional ArsR family regulator